MLRIKQLTLLLADFCFLYIGFYFGLYLRFFKNPADTYIELLPEMSLLFVLATLILFINGLYDLAKTKNNWSFYKNIIISAFIWIIISVFFFYLINTASTPKTILLTIALAGFGLIALWRYLYNKFLSKNILLTKVIFIGETPETKELSKLFLNQPQLGYEVIKTIQSENDFQKMEGGNIYIITPEFEQNETILKNLYNEIFKQRSVYPLSDFYESITKKIPPFIFSEGWFLSNLNEQNKKIYDRFRILTDYIFAIILFMLFMLLYLPIGFLIKTTSKGNILYKQKRTSRSNTTFELYKFRTMKTLSADGSAELNGPEFAQDNDKRVTLIGKLLRKTRIDELPQCLNILKGEMALIGPRPERPNFVKELNTKMPFYNLRHLIKPGLTGWAQIKQGYTNTENTNLEKLEYDLYYIKHRGLLLDTTIALKTVNTIIRLSGK